MASPETKSLRSLPVLCINFQLLENEVTVGLKTMSVTDDVIDQPIPNKIIDWVKSL